MTRPVSPAQQARRRSVSRPGSRSQAAAAAGAAGGKSSSRSVQRGAGCVWLFAAGCPFIPCRNGSSADPAALEWRNVIRMRAHHHVRGGLHPRQQVGVAHEVGDLELHEAGLARAEQFARAAQLQVAAGDLEAVVRAAQHREPLLRERRERRVPEQHAARRLAAAADAAAQLVQLREPHALGILDDHQARVRHVDADLDHRGRDQQADAARLERRHRLLARAGRHAPVHDADCDIGQGRGEGGGRVLGGLRLEQLGLLDQRADPVGLPAREAGAADARTTSSRRESGIATVATGIRPGGSSSITETSRSA